MNRYNSDDELKHYGVLGMKWGSRKGRTWSSRQTRQAAKRLSKLESNPTKDKRYDAQVRGARTQLAKNKRLDAEMVRQARQMSIGKAVIKDLIYGGRVNEANMRYKAAAKLVGRGVSVNTLMNLQSEYSDVAKRRARNVKIAASAASAGVKLASKYFNSKQGVRGGGFVYQNFKGPSTKALGYTPRYLPYKG